MADVARPNIRIEIQNTMESMDVDGPGKFSDGEEGEIVEESVDFNDIIDNTIKYPSRPGGEPRKKATIQFKTENDEKCFERVQQFQQEQVSNFTTENLETLHESLGITSKNEKEVCFDILHLHGVEGMSDYDIARYFDNFPPIDVEWVDQNSCNVLWSDDVSSARALYHMSRKVHGMPVDGIHGKSILLKNNNREVVLDDSFLENDATLSDISIPIPAGYWRLGVPHDKVECILIRFAFISDRSFTDGNKYGTGLISESKKAQFRGIFDRNREITTKNPWGDLAKSWNRDRKTEEVVDTPQPALQLKHRLGFKRTQEEAFEEDEQGKKVVEKPKVPRMRMYADEEEAKIKRKKALDVLKRVGKPVKTEHKTGDLRKLIGKKVVEQVSCAVQPIEETEEGEIDDDFIGHKATIEEPIRTDVDLGSKLMNRRLKFTNPVPMSFHKPNESTDVRQRLDNKTKQNRFRDEILKNKRLKSPPPPPRPSNKHYSKYSHRNDYSDDQSDEEVYSDDDMDTKTGSKVTVVIKKMKKPTVASTVWSRVNTAGRSENSNHSVKNRLHLPADSSRNRRHKDSSASSDEGSASSDNSSSNEYHRMEGINEDRIKSSLKSRPGFRGGLVSDKMDEHKSPLRIEINNDRYKK